MSSKQKGRYSSKVAVSYYEGEGYLVDEVEKTGRFRKFKDLFSEHFSKRGRSAGFDLVAVHKSKEPIFIQVTTTTPKVHIDFLAFKGEFPTVGVEQYVRRKRSVPDLRIIYHSDKEKETIKI
jgi:hypothetical protein